MKLKGVVFDFNGTLFWDTRLHNKAWDLFLEKHGIRLPDNEKNEKIHGRNNHDILGTLFTRQLTEAEMNKFILEKEGIYQQLCLQTDMKLAPGAVAFLQFLNMNRIPCTIATASGPENVDFYFKHFGLNSFFDPSRVILNDGSIRSKPHPQIFRKAIGVLGIMANETLVFEDSYTGIIAAEKAGVGKIIIVDSGHRDYKRWNFQKIRSFDEVDRKLFLPI
ncbi:MAG: HAD family phosphatase [Bacteroidales bacterium]|nr:HAD family phosphatase [Bacteroidales bacterium]